MDRYESPCYHMPRLAAPTPTRLRTILEMKQQTTDDRADGVKVDFYMKQSL